MHAFYANHILLSPIWFKSSHSNHTIACIIWLFDNGSRTWSACIRDYHVLFLMNTSSNLIWELLNSRFGWTFKLLVYSVSRSFFCLLICNWWMHLQWKWWLPLTVCKREVFQSKRWTFELWDLDVNIMTSIKLCRTTFWYFFHEEIFTSNKKWTWKAVKKKKLPFCYGYTCLL